MRRRGKRDRNVASLGFAERFFSVFVENFNGGNFDEAVRALVIKNAVDFALAFFGLFGHRVCAELLREIGFNGKHRIHPFRFFFIVDPKKDVYSINIGIRKKGSLAREPFVIS
jgi:hypothetical protein